MVFNREPGSAWEESPTYLEFFVGSQKFVDNNLEKIRGNYSFSKDLSEDLLKCFRNMETNDFIIVALMAVGWSLLRHLVTIFLFQPLGRYCQLPRSEQEKMPESAWKFLFYLGSWTSVAYIILFKECCQYFHSPTLIWQGYSLELEVPGDIKAIYLIQISFYVHSIYTTLYVDHWRRDSLVLMAHHVITSLLLLFSLSTRCHRSGLLAIFLHDVCDILLEATKTSLYFKKQGKQTFPIFEIIANLGFVTFAFTWFITRLYWFPLRHVYVSSVYVNENGIQVPLILFLTSLCYVLLGMNCYWFTFILKLLYKVATGQVEELEDNRDYEEETKHEADLPGNGLAGSEDSSDKTNQVDSKSAGYYLRHHRSSILDGRSQ